MVQDPDIDKFVYETEVQERFEGKKKKKHM